MFFAKLIIDTSKVKLLNGLSIPGSQPYITRGSLVFNGTSYETDSFMFPCVSDDLLGLNLGHTTAGQMTMYSRTCNTMFEPYTEVVVACLRAAKEVGAIPTWTCEVDDDANEILSDGWDLFNAVKVKLTNVIN